MIHHRGGRPTRTPSIFITITWAPAHPHWRVYCRAEAEAKYGLKPKLHDIMYSGVPFFPKPYGLFKAIVGIHATGSQGARPVGTAIGSRSGPNSHLPWWTRESDFANLLCNRAQIRCPPPQLPSRFLPYILFSRPQRYTLLLSTTRKQIECAKLILVLGQEDSPVLDDDRFGGISYRYHPCALLTVCSTELS